MSKPYSGTRERLHQRFLVTLTHTRELAWFAAFTGSLPAFSVLERDAGWERWSTMGSDRANDARGKIASFVDIRARGDRLGEVIDRVFCSEGVRGSRSEP
ncbi:MAG: hypothetical protein R6U98_10485, partial [Pirellulaceae bacterium]